MPSHEYFYIGNTEATLDLSTGGDAGSTVAADTQIDVNSQTLLFEVVDAERRITAVSNQSQVVIVTSGTQVLSILLICGHIDYRRAYDRARPISTFMPVIHVCRSRHSIRLSPYKHRMQQLQVLITLHFCQLIPYFEGNGGSGGGLQTIAPIRPNEVTTRALVPGIIPQPSQRPVFTLPPLPTIPLVPFTLQPPIQPVTFDANSTIDATLIGSTRCRLPLCHQPTHSLTLQLRSFRFRPSTHLHFRRMVLVHPLNV
jgi:hypothetical protein